MRTAQDLFSNLSYNFFHRDSNAPKPNKRFLSSIIRSTDEHNKSVLKAQAEAAEEIKRERREQERRERQARAEEASAAERDRRRAKGKGREVDESSESWDRWDGRSADRKWRRRNWETWNGEEEDSSRRNARHHRSSRHHSEEEVKEAQSRRRSHRSSRPHSKSPSRDKHKRSKRRSASPKPRTTDREQELKEKLHSSRSKVRPRSLSPDDSRSSTPGPEPAPHVPSKMDRYFEDTYDPRMDVTAPHVPSTGLINNAEFEGWDTMLDLLRQRQEDKEEKKRLQRMGYSKDEIKKAISKPAASASSSQSNGIMDIEYKKRGAVREWDMGKKGF